MAAYIAPQFLRDHSGGVSSKRMILILILSLLTLWALLAGSGTPVKIPKRTPSDEQLMATIKNSTLGFQKIFVLNLKARSDRRDSMALGAALTGLKFDFLEAATDVSRKALPPNPKDNQDQEYGNSELGCWRSHLNAARKMVEEDIQTALILEDDVDWDIRIHEQLADFAKASRLLVQPKPRTTDEYLDPTIKEPAKEGDTPTLLVAGGHFIQKPTTSAYGDVDRWDLLWLGHCGTAMPEPDDHIPTGRVVILNDTTVPEWQHVKSEFSRNEKYKDEFPVHTRIVFRSAQNICTLGYALTQQGARRMLYDLGIREMSGQADLALQAFCLGSNGRPSRTCITAQPQYFQHHRPAGRASHLSDIGQWQDDNWREEPATDNIRLSTQINFAHLLDNTQQIIEHYKDGEGLN